MSDETPMKKSERIARALCRVGGDDPDTLVLSFQIPQMTSAGRYMVMPRGEKAQPLWQKRLPDAYAALEALGLADD